MKKLTLSLFLALCFLVPHMLWAIPAGLPFGGHVVFSTPCTCIPGSVFVQYDILHPISYPFTFHAILLVPTTIRYAYQQFLVLPPPTAWNLGKFVPAPGTPCLGVPPACTPPLADGIMVDVGSSFPGFVLP